MPASAQAACRAAPSATYSSGAGTSTGAPKMVGAIRRAASDRAPPPISSTRCRDAPCAAIRSAASASVPSTASIAARARLGPVMFCVVTPRSTPVASGRFGLRSPSR